MFSRLVAVIGFLCCVGSAAAQVDWPDLSLTKIASGFHQPTHVASARDGSGRLFVLEKGGKIWIVENGETLDQPFLDVSEQTVSWGECGLLAIAFPADYSTSGAFYLHYSSSPNGDGVVSRFHRSAGDPTIADPTSEEILLEIPQPSVVHNGGQLAFGPDGFLYIALGDGGGVDAGAPNNPAQDRSNLLGSILRIDVTSTPDPGLSYRIPPGNPYAGNTLGYREEIWAFGLRNPWRFSFDSLTGDLYIGDVGEDSREEINRQLAGSAGGQNYGWNFKEGTENFLAGGAGGLTAPLIEYEHAPDGSVIGGFVYRGTQHPRMSGIYFSGDFATGAFRGFKELGGTKHKFVFPVVMDFTTSFGEDEDGEILVLNFGNLYRLGDSGRALGPIVTPNGLVVSNALDIHVEAVSPGSTIHYTLDGSEPDASSPTVPSGGIVTVDAIRYFKAIAIRADLLPSEVVSTYYSFTTDTPVFVPQSAPWDGYILVTIESETMGAEIRYTRDGSMPTLESDLYTGSLAIGPLDRVRAAAFKPGYETSKAGSLRELRESALSVTNFAGNGTEGLKDARGSLARFAYPSGLEMASNGTLYVADSQNHRIRKVDSLARVTTLAGSSSGNVDGTGTSARFNDPLDVALEPSGNIVVTDRGNNQIRRITTGGITSTLATTIREPRYLIVDSAGTIRWSEWAKLWQLPAGGSASEFAGQGVNRLGGIPGESSIAENGAGSFVAIGVSGLVSVSSSAEVSSLVPFDRQMFIDAGPRDGYLSDAVVLEGRDLCRDAVGNFYYCTSSSVMKIRHDGLQLKLAGGESVALGHVNGSGDEARFYYPSGITVSTSGEIYVADTWNHSIRLIKQVDSDGDGIPDSAEKFRQPYVIGVNDAVTDTDGDGQSNAFEWITGTNPLLKNSAFKLEAAPLPDGGGMELRWKSGANAVYQCEYSLDLVTWKSEGGIIVGNGQDKILTSPRPEGEDKRFLRVVILPKK